MKSITAWEILIGDIIKIKNNTILVRNVDKSDLTGLVKFTFNDAEYVLGASEHVVLIGVDENFIQNYKYMGEI